MAASAGAAAGGSRADPAARSPLAAWLSGLAAAFLLGLGTPALHAALALPMPDLPRGAVEIIGRVTDLEALPEGVRLTLDRVRLGPEAPELPRQIRLRLQRGDPLRPEPGSVIRVRALLRPLAAPAVPGGWDVQRSAFFEGLGGSGFAIGRAEVAADIGGRPVARLRAEVERRVAEAIPGPAGRWRRRCSPAASVPFRPRTSGRCAISGLAHLLAVSGLHIGIVMGWPSRRRQGCCACSAAAAGAHRYPQIGRRWRRCLPGSAICSLTGAAVPVQRAFVMAALVMLGVFLDRTALSLRTVAAAAAVVLLLRPDLLLGPSFQMSFAAVLALVAGFEALRPHLDRLRQAPGWWRGLLLWGRGCWRVRCWPLLPPCRSDGTISGGCNGMAWRRTRWLCR